MLENSDDLFLQSEARVALAKKTDALLPILFEPSIKLCHEFRQELQKSGGIQQIIMSKLDVNWLNTECLIRFDAKYCPERYID